MKLSDFKGQDAFRVMGKLIKAFRVMFNDEKILEITERKEKAWVLNFLEYSLCEKADVWLDTFCALNPDIEAENVTTADVVKFAYDFMSDEQLMTLFFSQGRTTGVTTLQSASENTEG